MIEEEHRDRANALFQQMKHLIAEKLAKDRT
jgi:hypothetical protein